jgi:hypothetical protein
VSTALLVVFLLLVLALCVGTTNTGLTGEPDVPWGDDA